MKKIFLIGSLLTLSLAACQNSTSKPEEAVVLPVEESAAAVYGDSISASGAQSASQVPFLLASQDSAYAKLDGTALTSCAKKGCWMTVSVGEGEEMRVTFKDYGFFVPKDLNGQKVVMEGMLRRQVSTVDELRHYAEDTGKSLQEVAAIQQPDTVYTFEATGVLLWPQEKQGL